MGILLAAGHFQLFPDQASLFANDVDGLFFFLLTITAFFSILIAGLIVFFSVKYRRSVSPVRPPPPEKMWLELTWTILPLCICMVIFVWGARVFALAFHPPADALDIYVVGKQWMWKVQHPQGRREINELHIPAGRPVRLIMTSQDVIHDFFVPAFRVKQDVLPGRYTSEWFQATEPGEYHLFCAQYCGLSHADMIGTAVVMEPSKYAAWLAESPSGKSMTETGEALYRQFGCNACHGTKAPSLAGLFDSNVVLQNGQTVRADESYLRESILAPRAKIVSGYQTIMPTYKGQMSEEQLAQIIEYIKSLRAFREPEPEKKQ